MFDLAATEWFRLSQDRQAQESPDERRLQVVQIFVKDVVAPSPLAGNTIWRGICVPNFQPWWVSRAGWAIVLRFASIGRELMFEAMMHRLNYFDAHPASSTRQVLIAKDHGFTKGRSRTPDDLCGPNKTTSTCGSCSGWCAMLGPFLSPSGSDSTMGEHSA